jgi:hypothetical protein
MIPRRTDGRTFLLIGTFDSGKLETLNSCIDSIQEISTAHAHWTKEWMLSKDIKPRGNGVSNDAAMLQ